MILLPRPPASAGRGISGLFGDFSRMPLTPDQLQRIALLARIEVSAEEQRGVTDRLNAVLGLIDQLQAVDTRGIEPMAHPLDARLSVRQRLRPDAITEPNRREDYQKGAPAAEKGLYLVPKVLE